MSNLYGQSENRRPRRSGVPGWPTTKSQIGRPWIRLAVAILILFLAIGFGCIAVAFQEWDSKVPIVVGWVLGGGFILFALVGLAALVSDRLAIRSFEHATEEVLPLVPREPLLAPGQVSFSHLTHQLETTSAGCRLVPKRSTFQRIDRFLYSWMVFISVLATALIWALPGSGWIPVNEKVGISAAFCVIAFVCAWLISGFYHGAMEGLVVVEIDRDQGVCVLTFPDETLTVPLQQFVAVQLCAAIRKVDLSDGPTSFPAVELNLVLENDESADSSNPYRRITVMNLKAGFDRLIPIGRGLADALGVPLLNHATPEHWKLEEDRSKERPCESGGYM